jgi:general secretion pathway protein F
MAESRVVSLEHLIALSDEIAALARAGIPLETGLRALARDLPGRLRKLAERLGNHLEQGCSLAEALEATADYPAAYRAVIAAGVRSGNLAVALEGIASTCRRAQEVRRLTVASMVYPLFVAGVASVVFAFGVTKPLPVVLDAVTEFGLELPAWLRLASQAGKGLLMMLPALWGLLLIGLTCWYWRARSAMTLAGDGTRRLPVWARLVFAGRLATFTEVLALLIEQQVPLHEALVLAGDASGSRQLQAGAAGLAERLQRGESGATIPAGIPPLLSWMLARNASSPQLVQVLRQSAAAHRQRASELALWVGLYLPVLVCAAVGGLVTFLYVILVMAPFYYLMQGLA